MLKFFRTDLKQTNFEEVFQEEVANEELVEQTPKPRGEPICLDLTQSLSTEWWASENSTRACIQVTTCYSGCAAHTQNAEIWTGLGPVVQNPDFPQIYTILEFKKLFMVQMVQLTSKTYTSE